MSSSSPIQPLPDGTEPGKINSRTGYLPLHESLVNPHRSMVRIQQLLDAWPDAVRVQLTNGRLALHFAARCADAKIVQEILTIHPTAIQIATMDGRLPLDYAIAGNADIQVIQILLNAWEESKNHIDSFGVSFLAKAISNSRETEIVEAFCTEELLNHVNPTDGQTILHHAILQYKSKHQHLDLILRKAPHLISQPDTNGCLPLHVAAGIPHFPSKYLRALIKLYPDALKIQCTIHQNLPLHTILSADGPFPQAKNVALLIHNSDALKVRNANNLTPLELFSRTAGMSIQSYEKAQTILATLIDPNLPFHDIANRYTSIPDAIREKYMQTSIIAAARQDADHWYARQVAAMQTNVPLSFVYDLLRCVPLTLLMHTNKKKNRKVDDEREDERSMRHELVDEQ